MSEETASTQQTTITVDDLRDKAIQLRDLAEAEARDFARDRGTQAVVVAVVAVVMVVSLAYYLGTRRA